MSITVQRTRSEPVPAGMYVATIEKVEAVDSQLGSGLVATFLLDEEGFEGKRLTGWADLNFMPESELYGWVCAAVFSGRDVPESYWHFSSGDLIGCRVFLTVTIEKGGDGETYNRVSDLLPYKKAQPARNAQSPALMTLATAASTAPAGEGPDGPDRDQGALLDSYILGTEEYITRMKRATDDLLRQQEALYEQLRGVNTDIATITEWRAQLEAAIASRDVEQLRRDLEQYFRSEKYVRLRCLPNEYDFAF